MFWGWGRILGGLLGGPLGTLGRPPGACKAKAVSRVCFSSVDACDDDSKNVACDCHQVATLQQANVTTNDPAVRSVRFGSAVFNAGHEFFQRLVLSKNARLQSLLIPAKFHEQIQPRPAEDGDDTSLKTPPKEIPFLLKLLLTYSRSSVVRFSDDKHRFNEYAVSTKSREAGANENQVQRNDVKTKEIAEPLKRVQAEAIVNTDGDSKTEESKADGTLLEERRQIEEDLRRTQQRMDLALTGIRGLDLIAEGKFEQGFELLTYAAERGDPESLYNVGVVYERGFGRKRNPSKAIRFYEAAANLNHAPSCYNLAVMYQNGGQAEKAERVMVRAAELGLPEAVEIVNRSKYR